MNKSGGETKIFSPELTHGSYLCATAGRGDVTKGVYLQNDTQHFALYCVLKEESLKYVTNGCF